jgi:hypothetical protein
MGLSLALSHPSGLEESALRKTIEIESAVGYELPA